MWIGSTSCGDNGAFGGNDWRPVPRPQCASWLMAALAWSNRSSFSPECEDWRAVGVTVSVRCVVGTPRWHTT